MGLYLGVEVGVDNSLARENAYALVQVIFIMQDVSDFSLATCEMLFAWSWFSQNSCCFTHINCKSAHKDGIEQTRSGCSLLKRLEVKTTITKLSLVSTF